MKTLFGFFSTKTLLRLFAFFSICLFLYTFTQVDLSLTLSKASLWQYVQKDFQYIGYFNRPLSTYLYIGIITILFYLYGALLYKANHGEVPLISVWKYILGVAILLGFSYNAFSYDLFNYIFDAKIITNYHLNPYLYKALDFPNEPMLSFMRWTHRTYPYGPMWLVLTVPLSYIGLQYFLPTFFLFKALTVTSFLGAIYLIGKTIRKISPKHETIAVVFLGLSPFVLIEGLISAHNDIVMSFFTVLTLYYFVRRKLFFAFTTFVVSYGIKLAAPTIPFVVHTGVVAVVAVLFFLIDKFKHKMQWEKMFTVLLIVMIIPVVLASLRTNFQPWYLLFLFPFATLVSYKKYILVPLTITSYIVLFEYVPYLYLGNWNPPVPTILFWITTVGVGISLLAALLSFDLRKNS